MKLELEAETSLIKIGTRVITHGWLNNCLGLSCVSSFSLDLRTNLFQMPQHNLSVVQNLPPCYRSPPRGRVVLRVGGCDEVIAVSQAKPMSHGSFGYKRSMDHRHAASPYSSLTTLCFSTQTSPGGGRGYESAEVCGSLCPYMGSVRLGVLWPSGNSGRFLECLVAQYVSNT